MVTNHRRPVAPPRLRCPIPCHPKQRPRTRGSGRHLPRLDRRRPRQNLPHANDSAVVRRIIQHFEYDARDSANAIIETVHEWTLYGERATDAADDNRLGTAWRAFDAAGMVESTGFTFAGQPLGSVRRLTSGWVGQSDWTAALQALSTSVSAAQTESDTLLETTAYVSAMTWDALGRPVTTTRPAESGRGCIDQTFWTSTERLGYTAAPSPRHSSHRIRHLEAPSYHR